MYILEVIILLGILVLVHELGHFLSAKSIGIPVRQFALGFGPALFSKRWGETDLRINALPLGGYCAFADDMEEEEEPDAPPIDPKTMLRHRGWWERAFVISAGVLSNFLLAYFILVAMVAVVGVASPKPGVAVQNLIPEMPGIQAGLQPGDAITRIDSQTVQGSQDFINTVRKHAGQKVLMTVERKGQTLTIPVTPTSQGKIGAGIQGRFQIHKAQHFWDPLVLGAKQQWDMTVTLLDGLGQLFTGRMPLSSVGGPIEIVNIGSKVAQADPSNLFAFTALISIELAIINFLPLPALDGGLIIMLILEAIRRKRLPQKLEMRINQVGLVALLGLGVLLIIKDIVSISRSMLGG